MDSPPPPKPTASQGRELERRLTDKLVRSGALTSEQMERCRSHQSRLQGEGRPASLAQILIANGLITGTQLDVLVAEVLSEESPAEPVPPEAATRPESERFGKFIRVLQLGSGGMGEVWKAWDTQLRRWVALKFLKGRDREDIARLMREAQTAGRLSHPNILPVHEVGSERGEHYIAMQFVEGQTLETWPRKDRKSLIRVMRDASRAVALAHREGVVHRDLKPSNILVAGRQDAPHAFVADFGLAKSMSDPARLSQSGVLMGTPEFMSPEQARGEAADERSDVWALGATMYELTTDRVPFPGPNSLQVLKKVLEDEPRTPRTIQPRISPDLETIILKCLEKDAARRYATADDLADDLDRYLSREPIQARPPSRFYRIRKRLGKRKALVSVIAASAVVVLALAGLLWFGERPEREHLLSFKTGMVAWEELLRSSFGRVDAARLKDQARRTREQFERANAWLEKPEAHIMRARCFELEKNVAGMMESLERAHALEPRHPDARVELARGLLCRYLERRGSPAILHDSGVMHVEEPPPESAGEIALRTRAKSLLEDPGIVSRKQDLLEALLAMARREYLTAGDRFQRHTAVDGLDTEALMLEGACRFYSREYPAALEAFGRSLRLAPSADVHNWVGLALHARQDLPGAIGDFERAIEIDPRHYLARVNRGNARLEQKRFAEASADFTAAIELAPGVALAYCNRGNARQELLDFAGAVEDFTKALELRPRFATAFYNRGNARRVTKDYRAAILDYTKAIEIDAKLALAYCNRGLAHFMLREYQECLRDAERSLELNPKIPPAYLTRATARQELGDLEGAVRDCDKAIELMPTFATAFYNRGNARRLAQDYRAAIQDYTKAIEFDSKLVLAYCNRGLAHCMLREYPECLRDVERALELDLKTPEAYLTRGTARQELGDLEGAVRDCDKAIELNPTFATAFYNRGNARRLAQDYRAAIQDYSKAIEFDSKLALAYCNRGLAHCMLREYQECLRDVERALELDPKMPEAHLTRGTARQHLGDLEGAVRDCDKAIELKPTFAAAFYNRGNARRLSQDYSAAIQDYTKAIEFDPKFALAYCNRSLARYMLRDFREAIRDADRAIELDSIAFESYVCRGNARQELGDLEGAIRDFDKVIELQPTFAVAYYNRGNARRLREDYTSAAQDYTKAIELDPGYALAYLNRGLARMMLKDFTGAIADTKKVLESHPGRWEPCYNLACAYALKGDPAEALDWLEKSVDRGFRDVDHLSKDTDLDSLRREKRFQDLLKRLSPR